MPCTAVCNAVRSDRADWHGITQNGSPWMDGVPGVSQVSGFVRAYPDSSWLVACCLLVALER
jgi:hypothetical protein